jgi:hypothetical protein
MFVSMPDFEFHVPAPLAVPGAFYARAMALSTHSAWFILTTRTSEPEPTVNTLLLAWDVDVVDVLNSASNTLESLMFVAPRHSGRTSMWVTKHIAEIWQATDLSDDSECVLMVTEDGLEHSGYFMEQTKTAKRRRLVARAPVGTTKRRATS